MIAALCDSRHSRLAIVAKGAPVGVWVQGVVDAKALRLGLLPGALPAHAHSGQAHAVVRVLVGEEGGGSSGSCEQVIFVRQAVRQAAELCWGLGRAAACKNDSRWAHNCGATNACPAAGAVGAAGVQAGTRHQASGQVPGGSP